MSQKFPNFVSMDYPSGATCCLILVSKGKDSATYFRDGGDWDVDAKYVNGQLTTLKQERHATLSEKPLRTVTKKVWQECNGDYARRTKLK